MKKVITKKQLQELDSHTHHKLKVIAVKKGYWKDGAGAILNIGEMIEFLTDNGEHPELDSYEDFCDDLWRNVKELLKTLDI